MKRIYPSGAEKKRKKIARQAEEERGKRTLLSFLQPTSSKIEENIDEGNIELVEGKTSSPNKVDLNASEEKATKHQGRDDIVDPCEQEDSNENSEGLRNVPCIENDKLELPTVSEAPLSTSVHTSNDPSTWGNLNNKSRDLIVIKGPPSHPSIIPRDSSNRQFPKSIFKKKLNNGETVERDWLVWSEQSSAVFCFCCCLFKDNVDSSATVCKSMFLRGGMKDNWKKIYTKVKSHESNVDHLQNYIKWKELLKTLKEEKTAIDEALLKQIKEEEAKWRRILAAVIDVVLFLAERNLAFRGGHSTLDSDDCGNFLSTFKLIGKYNNEINAHLESVEKARNSGKKNHTNYLSWRIQNEFLELCGNKVKETIIQEIKNALYFSIIVDGTPDVSHKEQLVFIVRYVLEKNGSWDVYERFIHMLDHDKKTGEAIAHQIAEVLKNCGLEMSCCRGQSYDNASNMSGRFKGVKSRILGEVPQAYFSPCSAHTLNLCGVHAMETSVTVKTFFGNVQKLYKLFALSPSRWKILQNTANISLHSVSTTRWSARIDAVRPLVKKYSEIVEALEKINEDPQFTAEIQADVTALLSWIKSFEFVLLSTIWFKILQSMDDTNKTIQSEKLTLNDAESLIKTLLEDLQTIRNSWSNLLNEAKLVATNLNIEPVLKTGKKRKIKKKVFFDEKDNPEDDFESDETAFKVTVILPTMDLLISEIKSLKDRMGEVSSLFSPLIAPFSFKVSNEEGDSKSTEDEGLPEEQFFSRSAEALQSAYPNDLDQAELSQELRIYQKTVSGGILKLDGSVNSAIKILNQIFDKGLQNVFPQICIALRLMIVLPVSVASGERAFSKMALIKNKLRSTMGENRLNHLLLLSIEHDFVKSINFDDIINDFARAKARRVNL